MVTGLLEVPATVQEMRQPLSRWRFQALVGQGFKYFPMGRGNASWEPPFRSLDRLLFMHLATRHPLAGARQSIWMLVSWRLGTSVPVKPCGPAFPPQSFIPNHQP